MVTGGYFAGLGVAPVLGRPITESDARQGAAPVAVISYGYWQRAFAGSVSVLGQHIMLNGQPYTIVGVAPPKFFGLQAGRHDDIWVPVVETKALHPWASNPPIAGQSMFTSQQWWWLTVIGRLQPGVSQQQAAAALTPVLQSGFQSAFGPLKPANQPSMEAMSGHRGLDYLEGFYTGPLRILMGIVALLLLATCAGLATLLLARAAARSKEMAVRMATGATRARVVRQLLTESVLLSGCGGGLGLLLAFALAHGLAALLASGDYPLRVDVSPDPLVLAFTAAASVLTGILFGLAPAWRAVRVDLVASLKETTGTSLGEVRHRFTLGKVLIVLQVAVSMLLLVGAGYMLRSLQKLEYQNIGIARDHRLVFSIDPTLNGYNNRQQLQLYQTMLSRLQSLPGVKSATTVTVRLISSWFSNGNVDIEGYRPADRNKPLVFFNAVGPQFLETTGIRLLAGRDINDHDTPTSPKVAVINQAMAEKYFGGRNPIGLHITGKRNLGRAATYEIVGICANAKYTNLRQPIAPTFYYPYTQQRHFYGMNFYLQTAGGPTALVPAVRHVVHDLDPSLLVTDIRSQSDQIDESIVPERMLARLASFFGVLALLLVAIGLNGTLAYAVNRRAQEIGIRMALGAQRGQVVLLVLGESLLLIALGMALGIPLAAGSAKLLSSQMYGIQSFDPPTLIGATVVLLLTAGVSGYVPARRAASIDPMQALRSE
jgi:predicted permease